MGSRTRRALPAHNIEHWRDRARCKPGSGHDPRLWWPDDPIEWATRNESQALKRRRHEMTEQARTICMQCPVRGDCLDYAIELGETEGIWGGLTPNERGATPLR